ncbi:MAG: hypothetical protein EBX37_06340, partial [Alphaproteobacteria bacterium]|nr:hypothetical protein [Alphaproteobacteria bacterium]
EEVQRASVGAGVGITFREHGVQKVVLMQAGDHYIGPFHDGDRSKPKYMIPGGFINLTETTGTRLVAADAKPEDPRVGAVRETEEELIDDKGKPLLTIDPARLKAMDAKSLAFRNGDRHVALGFLLELTPDEAKVLKAHAERMESDKAYHRAVREHTINPDTGKPEACTVKILPLKEVVEGKHALLYPDQKTLFERIDEHLNATEVRR